MFFQPEPTLIPQSDGTYTLLVRTAVPSACYTPGPIEAGSPPDRVQIPELSPYTFEITHQHGICTPQLHYISASKTGLRPSDGHTALVIFTMVDGKVAGYVTVRFPPAGEAAIAQGNPAGWIVPDSVSATVFSGILGPAVLRVTALVSTPTPGYQAALVPAEPQGINPNILLLNLQLTPPQGQVIQMPSTVLASYEDEHYRGHYSDVTLANGSQHITVPVIVMLSALGSGSGYEFSTYAGG